MLYHLHFKTMRHTKVILIVALCLLAMSSYAQRFNAASQLLQKLHSIKYRGIMIGHEDDTVYGNSWKWEHGRSDVLSICGDYPAVVGFDLGRIEAGTKSNLEGVTFELIRREIIAHHERGGIITLSWHVANVVTGGNHRDLSGNPVKKILKRGGDQQKFNLALDKLADFIFTLKDRQRKLIPIIFRPWHEMSGDWFWWGTKSCTPSQFKELYAYTYRYLTAKGLNNLVWCFSMAYTGMDTRQRFETFYPGDAYVDIIGVDYYDTPNKKSFVSDVKKEMRALRTIAEEHHKLFAFTETGYKDNQEPEWYTQKLLPALIDSQPLYVLFWRNTWNSAKDYYGPVPGKKNAPDFKRFYANPQMLFLKDINQNTIEIGNTEIPPTEDSKKERPQVEGEIHFNF